MNAFSPRRVTLAALSCLALICVAAQTARAIEKPNILWITSEDNGPQLGCYGDAYSTTPNLDRLAAGGQIYLNCWSNAPVCAPARTTIVSGMYPTSLGAANMRSHVRFPKDFLLYPQIFQEQGYYCTNNSKEDYNVIKAKGTWNESSGKAHWRKRAPGQPFFAVFNFTTTHESQIRKRPHNAVHDPAKVKVPPYHPDTPEVREDWAQYYDQLTTMDGQVGEILQQLRDDKLDDSTIIVYYGDHGCGLPRGKRWLYQSGLHVPLIVSIPPKYQRLAGDLYKAGDKSTRLVSFVDLAPTMLSLIGMRPPENMQGQAFLGKHATEPRKYVYGFRDRMDERIDMARSVRDDRYLYIRNFYPHRPQGAYLDYMFQTPTTRTWFAKFADGTLTPEQSVFWKPKAVEELYDITNDPYQIKNLASEPSQSETLNRMRGALRSWMLEVRDVGLLPEGEMLDRSASDAPYTMGHDPHRYSPERLLDAADVAFGVAKESAIKDLLALRTATDPAVRYWVANGLLWRVQEDRDRADAIKAARGMLSDPSPYVRCVALETVARFGATSDRELAVGSLLKLVQGTEHNMFVAITALNSLDWCQPTVAELGSTLKGLSKKDSNYDERYKNYIPRLVERLQTIAKP